jgi:hypothetical protein
MQGHLHAITTRGDREITKAGEISAWLEEVRRTRQNAHVDRKFQRWRLYRAATGTRRARLVTAGGALAVVGVVVGVVVTQTGGGGTKPRGPSPPIVVSASSLVKMVKDLGHPVYWVGPRLGSDYELTSAPDGRIFLRYLPAGLKAGAPGGYLSVGTYPFQHAFPATIRAAGKQGFVRVQAGVGVAAAYARGRPTNIFVAFRGIDYQIEVFDPEAAEARSLVAQRRVVPVP